MNLDAFMDLSGLRCAIEESDQSNATPDIEHWRHFRYVVWLESIHGEICGHGHYEQHMPPSNIFLSHLLRSIKLFREYPEKEAYLNAYSTVTRIHPAQAERHYSAIAGQFTKLHNMLGPWFDVMINELELPEIN